MQDPRKRRVYHLALDLEAAVIATLTPRRASRVPGLRNQAIRSVTAIGVNIAEGCARATQAGMAHSLEVVLGELNEVEQWMTTASRAATTTPNEHGRFIANIGILRRMVISLQRQVLRDIAERENRQRDE